MYSSASAVFTAPQSKWNNGRLLFPFLWKSTAIVNGLHIISSASEERISRVPSKPNDLRKNGNSLSRCVFKRQVSNRINWRTKAATSTETIPPFGFINAILLISLRRISTTSLLTRLPRDMFGSSPKRLGASFAPFTSLHGDLRVQLDAWCPRFALLLGQPGCHCTRRREAYRFGSRAKAHDSITSASTTKVVP